MGCTKQNEASNASAPTTPAGTVNTNVKPTAEQEAARKRGEEMGSAIQAANEAAQKGNPPSQ